MDITLPDNKSLTLAAAKVRDQREEENAKAVHALTKIIETEISRGHYKIVGQEQSLGLETETTPAEWVAHTISVPVLVQIENMYIKNGWEYAIILPTNDNKSLQLKIGPIDIVDYPKEKLK